MKKNLFSKIMILTVCVVLMFAMTACKKKEPVDNHVPADTLVAGYSYFSNKFSPFFSKTSYDTDVTLMTGVQLLASDRMGNIVYKGIEGETIKYNGTTDYLYKGIADCDVVVNNDKTVTYNITIRNDVKFSDGTPMTIDDVIFSMYVLSDPSYDGSSFFYTVPIKGMKEYRTGVTADVYTKYSALADKILAAGQANATFTEFTQAQQETYFGAALDKAGIKFTQEIIDYVNSKYLSAAYADYMGPFTVKDVTGREDLSIAFAMSVWNYGKFTTNYDKDAAGTLGLVSEAYKNLWTVSATDTKVKDQAGTSYAKATAETANDALYYISAQPTENANYYGLTKYTGDRYKVGDYDGKFKDSDGNIYDFETTKPTVQSYWTCIKNAYEYDLSDEGMNLETAGSNIRDLVKDEFIAIEGPKDESMGGQTINKIEGIVRNNDYSVTVNMTKFDATAIYNFTFIVAPLHYYGDKAQYNFTANNFGFTKGNLSGVKAKTTVPLGAGPYVFKNFEQGVITFERNSNYYKGQPKTQYILFKETADADKVPGVIGTTFDVTEPSFNLEAASAIETANGNNQLTGEKITTNAVDFLGYGYIGINAATVNVGGDPSSAASKNLRKALATMISVYRETAVTGYYGNRASVINYPISNTSWAAPVPSDSGYAIAYSKDASGASIYTADMGAEAKFAAALSAAKGYLIAAGYTFDSNTNKFTGAPSGAKLDYEIIVGGDGKGDHPSFAICTFIKAEFAKIGINIIINDPADSNVLWNKLDAGTQEMWCAAWQATPDPDMYQIYHSDNVVGKGGTNSNHYHIQSTQLDDLIMKARDSADNAYRKATYKACLDIIMDWGVEIPIYQRQECFVFNNSRVNVATVTPDITTFWDWLNDIEKVEMK